MLGQIHRLYNKPGQKSQTGKTFNRKSFLTKKMTTLPFYENGMGYPNSILYMYVISSIYTSFKYVVASFRHVHMPWLRIPHFMGEKKRFSNQSWSGSIQPSTFLFGIPPGTVVSYIFVMFALGNGSLSGIQFPLQNGTGRVWYKAISDSKIVRQSWLG